MFKVKVVLEGSRPAIWRRLSIPGDLTFTQLHDVLQIAFDWSDAHPHHFTVNGEEYGPSCNGGVKDGSTVRIGDVVQTPDISFTYRYNSWTHVIEIQDIVSVRSNGAYPKCLSGRGATPKESEHGRPKAFSAATVNVALLRAYCPHLPDAVREMGPGARKPRSRLTFIEPGERVGIELSKHDRQIVLFHTKPADQVMRPLWIVPKSDSERVFYSLAEIEYLIDALAAAANEVNERSRSNELLDLCCRLMRVAVSYRERGRI